MVLLKEIAVLVSIASLATCNPSEGAVGNVALQLPVDNSAFLSAAQSDHVVAGGVYHHASAPVESAPKRVAIREIIERGLNVIAERDLQESSFVKAVGRIFGGIAKRQQPGTLPAVAGSPPAPVAGADSFGGSPGSRPASAPLSPTTGEDIAAGAAPAQVAPGGAQGLPEAQPVAPAALDSAKFAQPVTGGTPPAVDYPPPLPAKDQLSAGGSVLPASGSVPGSAASIPQPVPALPNVLAPGSADASEALSKDPSGGTDQLPKTHQHHAHAAGAHQHDVQTGRAHQHGSQTEGPYYHEQKHEQHQKQHHEPHSGAEHHDPHNNAKAHHETQQPDTQEASQQGTGNLPSRKPQDAAPPATDFVSAPAAPAPQAGAPPVAAPLGHVPAMDSFAGSTGASRAGAPSTGGPFFAPSINGQSSTGFPLAGANSMGDAPMGFPQMGAGQVMQASRAPAIQARAYQKYHRSLTKAKRYAASGDQKMGAMDSGADPSLSYGDAAADLSAKPEMNLRPVRGSNVPFRTSARRGSSAGAQSEDAPQAASISKPSRGRPRKQKSYLRMNAETDLEEGEVPTPRKTKMIPQRGSLGGKGVRGAFKGKGLRKSSPSFEDEGSPADPSEDGELPSALNRKTQVIPQGRGSGGRRMRKMSKAEPQSEHHSSQYDPGHEMVRQRRDAVDLHATLHHNPAYVQAQKAYFADPSPAHYSQLIRFRDLVPQPT